MKELPQIIVKAIRRANVIGEGSCSVIDECYSDAELIESMSEKGITTIPAALKHFRAIHDGWAERIQADEVAAHPTDPTPSEREKMPGYCQIGMSSCRCGWSGDYPVSGCPKCHTSFVS